MLTPETSTCPSIGRESSIDVLVDRIKIHFEVARKKAHPLAKGQAAVAVQSVAAPGRLSHFLLRAGRFWDLPVCGGMTRRYL